MTAERDYDAEAQRAGEERLAVLAEVQEAYAYGYDAPERLTRQLAGPACEGCDTCTVREVLSAAWPILLDAARAELAR